MRNRMRRDSGTSSLRVAMMVWISTAHSVALITLGELGQDSVAGSIDDAAAVAADQRQDHRLMPLEGVDRRGLVLPHEPAVAGDVGGENGSEPALHRGVVVHHYLFSHAAGASSRRRQSW